MRHDVIARILYNEICRKDNPEDNEIRIFSIVVATATHNKMEYYWNISARTSIKYKHNTPDIWYREEKLYRRGNQLPVDVKVKLKISEK